MSAPPPAAAPPPERPIAHVYDAAYAGVPNWDIGRPQRAFVRAGFRPAPATGEDPAGLVLSLAFLLGYGLVLVGAGGLGVALRRAEARPALAAGLLVLAAHVPFAAVGLRLGSLLPLPVGRLLVGTNAAFVPFGAAWAALGYRVWSGARGDATHE
jgi:hypothetical protein